MRWVLVAAGLLAASVLAGCAEGGNGANVPDGLQVEDVDIDPASRRGAISGVVVDEAIRPIVGANVTVQGVGNFTTGDAGTFALEDLEPGVYFLGVSAPGFLSIQTSTEVVAGAVATARVLMQLDPTPQPYQVTIKFDGFVDASAPLVSYITNIVIADTLNQTTCRCLWHFDSGNATTIVFEMVWEPSNAPPAGPPMDMYYQMYEEGKPDIIIQSEYVETPYVVHLDRQEIWDDWTYFRVHFGGSATWVNVNQPFTAFATFWYNGAAPEGWSFVGTQT